MKIPLNEIVSSAERTKLKLESVIDFSAKSKKRKKKSATKKELSTMNVCLVLVFITLIAFTVTMLVLFARYQMIPDTLCTCVFACLGGECGVLGWIKNTKEKYKERSWQLADRKAGNPATGSFSSDCEQKSASDDEAKG